MWQYVFAYKRLFYFFTPIFWLCWVFVAVHRLSLVEESRGYSLVAVHGILIVVALLCRAYVLRCMEFSICNMLA